MEDMLSYIYVLDGNHFNNLEEFYDEVDRVFTENLAWETGHNYDAFKDILRGGFGKHEYGEPIVVQWKNYDRSKQVLKPKELLNLLEIISDCDNTDYDCKLEIYH